MRALKVLPVLVLFLLLTSGQSLQMVERAYAACCNIWIKGCVSWHGMVYGSTELLFAKGTPMFRLTDDKGFMKDIKGSQEMVDEFISEFPGDSKIDYGFAIVSSSTGEPVLVAFVPVDPKNHKKPSDTTLPGAGGAVQAQNKLFEEVAQRPQH